MVALHGTLTELGLIVNDTLNSKLLSMFSSFIHVPSRKALLKSIEYAGYSEIMVYLKHLTSF